jgi:hypothetical protein
VEMEMVCSHSCFFGLETRLSWSTASIKVSGCL